MDLTSLGMASPTVAGPFGGGLSGVTGVVVGITVVNLLTAVPATRAKEIGSAPSAAGHTQRRIHGADGHDNYS